MSELAVIPLARIRPNLNQVRRTFHRIDELARSISQYGLLQNLVVRPLPEAGYYEIVAGERLYRALTLLAKGRRYEDEESRELVWSTLLPTDVRMLFCLLSYTGERVGEGCGHIWSN